MANALAGLYDGARLSQSFQDTFDKSRLNRLAGEAYSAPRDQRQSILGQMASINPQAAQAQQKQFQADEDRQTKLLVNGARYMKGALDSKNPNAVAGAWRTVRPSLIRAGLATEQELAPEWDPSYEQTVHQVLAIGDGAGSGNVQSTYIDGDGNRVAIMRDGSTQVLGRNDAGANQQTLTIDVNGVPTQVTFDRRTGRYTNASLDAPVQTSMGAYIDPNLPAEVQSQIRQSLAAGQEPPSQMVFAGSPLVGRRKEDEAAAVEAAKQRAQLDYLPQELGMRTDAAIRQAEGTQMAKDRAERAAQAPKRIKQYEQALSASQNVMQSIDKALGMLGPMSTGFIGARSRGIEGSPAFNLASEIETIKANLGFDRLQQMRDNSPTGGALGAIAVQELVALQSTIANLDPNQSEGQIRANLERVRDHYQRWQVAVQNAMAEEKGSPQAPSAGRTVVRTGTSNGRRVIQYSDGSIEYGN